MWPAAYHGGTLELNKRSMQPKVNRQWVENLLSLYQLGELKEWARVTEPGLHERHRVVTPSHALVLWVHAHKPFWDLVLEKDLLLHLEAQQQHVKAAVCAPLANLAGGYFFPLGDRYVCLTPQPEGRQLAPFEVDEPACAAVGAWLARFHKAARTFKAHKRHPYRLATVRRWLAAVPLDPELVPVLTDLAQECDALAPVLGRCVPGGIIHGGPGPGCMRFAHGALVQVMGFDRVSAGPWLMDLARAVFAWAVNRDQLVPARAQALVAAYQAVRPLRPVEGALMWAYVRWAAANAVLDPIRVFEVHQRGAQPAGYRDYAHAWRAWQSLKGMGRAPLQRALLPRGGRA